MCQKNSEWKGEKGFYKEPEEEKSERLRRIMELMRRSVLVRPARSGGRGGTALAGPPSRFGKKKIHGVKRTEKLMLGYGQAIIDHPRL